MKLSELIKTRRDLEYISPYEYEHSLNTSLSNLREQLKNKDKAAIETFHDISASQESINQEFSKIRKSLQDYKSYIDFCIAQQESEFYNISNDIYKDSFNDNAEYIFNRKKESLTFADQENKELFTSRLGMLNSWKYPALEIRPAFGEITEFIKGCDPLYLLDTDLEMFSQVKQLWNPQYQNRLRYYTFSEDTDNPLHQLPNNQFGLILSVDYFNFKPLHIIEKFLKEFYTKLKPGGIAMFTYNNCDLPYAVRNVENRFCCYTPGKAVKDIAVTVGFDVYKSVDRLENISWLELKKPGEISSIRGGQTLGEIRSFN